MYGMYFTLLKISCSVSKVMFFFFLCGSKGVSWEIWPRQSVEERMKVERTRRDVARRRRWRKRASVHARVFKCASSCPSRVSARPDTRFHLCCCLPCLGAVYLFARSQSVSARLHLCRGRTDPGGILASRHPQSLSQVS